MATPVVLVSLGAMPVIEAASGVPVSSVASNATPVTLSLNGGMPVIILDASNNALNLVVDSTGDYVVSADGDYVVSP